MVSRRQQQELLKFCVSVARKLGREGSALTFLIGELRACEVDPRLIWNPTKGFDAKRGSIKVQIKTRRAPRGKRLPQGRIGVFGDKDFHEGRFVGLHDNWDLAEIWSMPKNKILAKEKEQGMKGVSPSWFRNNGKKLYP